MYLSLGINQIQRLDFVLLNLMWFCQTDAASVLSEAIEYTKFLHQQVSVS